MSLPFQWLSLSLCLIECRGVKTCMAPRSINSNTRWKWVVSFTRPATLPRLGGSQTRSGYGVEREMSLPPKSKLYYDRRSVGQSVLVSSTHLGLTTIFFPVWQWRVCWCGRPLWREDGSVFYNVHNIFTFYMLLHECIYKMYTRLLSVQAQYSRWCPIYSSFCLWILLIILFHEIWDNFCNGQYFLLWHSTIEFCHQLLYYSYYSQLASTDWPVACCSCECKGTGTLGSIVDGPASTAVRTLITKFFLCDTVPAEDIHLYLEPGFDVKNKFADGLIIQRTSLEDVTCIVRGRVSKQVTNGGWFQ
jgi:hypothetical protein